MPKGKAREHRQHADHPHPSTWSTSPPYSSNYIHQSLDPPSTSTLFPRKNLGETSLWTIRTPAPNDLLPSMFLQLGQPQPRPPTTTFTPTPSPSHDQRKSQRSKPMGFQSKALIRTQVGEARKGARQPRRARLWERLGRKDSSMMCDAKMGLAGGQVSNPEPCSDGGGGRSSAGSGS